MKKVLLVLLFVPLVSFAQVQVSGQTPTYGNPNPQPIQVQVQTKPNQRLLNSINSINSSIRNASSSVARSNYAIAAAENAKANVYASDLEMRQSVEIASNPSKGFQYGEQVEISKRTGYKFRDWQKSTGIKNLKSINFKAPHKSLFNVIVGSSANFENTSDNNIKTVLDLEWPYEFSVAKNRYIKDYPDFINFGAEKAAEFSKLIIGTESNGYNIIHKTISRVRMFEGNGYRGTLYYEDKYDRAIKDFYFHNDKKEGIKLYTLMSAKFSGDKNEISFEQLETRRQYLRSLIEQHISNLSITLK